MQSKDTARNCWNAGKHAESQALMQKDACSKSSDGVLAKLGDLTRQHLNNEVMVQVMYSTCA